MQTTKSLFAPAVALALCAACTTSSERGDIVAIKIVEPTASTGTTTGCVLDTGTPELTFGSFDPSLATSYTMGLVVENRLASNANTASGRLNTNDFQVEQARISYELPDNPKTIVATIGEHVVPANALIPASTTGVAGVVLAPADVIALLKGQQGDIRFKVRLEGRLLDGSGVNSSQYEYVARVCSPYGSAGCGGSAPACTAPATLHTCAAGQDSAVFCQ